jgi:hypothetical protein
MVLYLSLMWMGVHGLLQGKVVQDETQPEITDPRKKSPHCIRDNRWAPSFFAFLKYIAYERRCADFLEHERDK